MMGNNSLAVRPVHANNGPFYLLRRYRLLAHVLFWAWVYVLDVFIFGVGYENVPQFTMMALLEMPGQLFLAYITAYWILPRYFSKLNHFESLLLFLGAVFINGLIGHTLFIVTDTYTTPVVFGYIPKILLMGFYCFLKACFFIIIKVLIDWYNTQQALAEAEHQQVRSELKVLKDQVNPHFMFNTLNNLYGLIAKNPIHAQESVLGLSDILHYMLHESNQDQVTVLQEVKCIRDYIELERLRYPGNLAVSMNVQAEAENLSILPLSLFPFVENSFKHGASEIIKDAWINIDISIYKDDFIFKIENSRTLSHKVAGNGIGLKNVKRRLEITYGSDHSLQIWDADETFLVILKIALSKMPKSDIHAYENAMSHR
jgi:two-component system, LytTR family, sensor kinase